jgi:acyl carrier protein
MNPDNPIHSRIKKVIIRVLDLEIEPEEIDSQAQLFGGGLGLNSMATIEIIVGLEEEFEIEVPDEDLRVELFDSVQAMADYVESVLQSPDRRRLPRRAASSNA